ncbi:MAG: HesA/MoeB/ThiF family protein [Pedobacter sp.]|nr:HesA/MoeB/ThiF family protein [Pedobacter sp.]
MKKNLNRYDRQTKLLEVGIIGQEKLQKAKVLIVGIGGLGCPASQYLAAAGVGTIGLMDQDKVDISNLHRQILFSENHLGKPKVLAAKERLLAMNSNVKIKIYEAMLTANNSMELFADYDLIIDGTDNFQSKYLIDDTALKTNKPWIYASTYRHQGQLSVFNYQNGPTYRCLFPKTPSNNVSCEEMGVLGVLPGILGTWQAAEALKIILGLKTVISGRLKIMDLLTLKEQEIRFERNEEKVREILNRPLQVQETHCEIKSGRFYLDVREPHEMPHATTLAILRIPLNQLAMQHANIPKNQEVYVFCQSGLRSKTAIQLLETEFGFNNLINVDGGIQTLKI